MFRQRGRFLRSLLKVACVLLVFRVLAGIVYEYQWYFPPNFHVSGFLAGREAFFTGAYRVAFYSHIVSGPFAILIGMFLHWSGSRRLRIGIHRFFGKFQFLLIVIFLIPSGLVMATRAYTGPIAGSGFVLLSIMTLLAAVLSVMHVKRGDLILHRRWATRLLILLLSTILLRVMSGLFIGFGIEPQVSYRFSAWGSWLIPLIAFEVWRLFQFRNAAESYPQRRSLGKLSSNHIENVT